MAQECEVCARQSGSAAAERGRKLRRVLIEQRLVALCERHALRVRQLDPVTVEELRRIFREPRGQRSLLERRAPLDRRVFPARPEGRRASGGRRTGD